MKYISFSSGVAGKASFRSVASAARSSSGETFALADDARDSADAAAALVFSAFFFSLPVIHGVSILFYDVDTRGND
jgi:hypothetical protein